jgi:hypothetical protein
MLEWCVYYSVVLVTLRYLVSIYETLKCSDFSKRKTKAVALLFEIPLIYTVIKMLLML